MTIENQQRSIRLQMPNAMSRYSIQAMKITFFSYFQLYGCEALNAVIGAWHDFSFRMFVAAATTGKGIADV